MISFLVNFHNTYWTTCPVARQFLWRLTWSNRPTCFSSSYISIVTTTLQQSRDFYRPILFSVYFLVYPTSHCFFSKRFRPLSADGFSRQHPYNAQVTKRKAGVKLKMSEQENAIRSCVFATDKMVLFCETSTRPVKLIIIPVTRPHKEHNKISTFIQKQSIAPTWNYIFVFPVCSSRISTEYLK